MFTACPADIPDPSTRRDLRTLTGDVITGAHRRGSPRLNLRHLPDRLVE